MNQACYQDIQDIQATLHKRQSIIDQNDPILDRNGKIQDIEEYLSSKQNKEKNRNGFLKVFVPDTKKNGDASARPLLQKTSTIKSSGFNQEFGKKQVHYGVNNMMEAQEGLKSRKNSLTNIIHQAEKLYGS